VAEAVVEAEVDARGRRWPRRDQRLRELVHLQPASSALGVRLGGPRVRRGEPLKLNLLALHGDRVLQPPFARDACLARLVIEGARGTRDREEKGCLFDVTRQRQAPQLDTRSRHIVGIQSHFARPQPRVSTRPQPLYPS